MGRAACGDPGGVGTWVCLRWAFPPEEAGRPAPLVRLARFGALAVAALLTVLSLYMLSGAAQAVGVWLAPRLAGLGFLGSFVGDLGEILELVIALIAALAAAGALGGLGGRLGRIASLRASPPTIVLLGLLVSPLAGAVVTMAVGALLYWLYEFGSLGQVLVASAAVGAVLGLALAVAYRRNQPIPVGMLIYYLARTLFNALRSIEAIIMVIVFVVWVGIGPFAGLLALSLHTVAALAKLYSEQVESILPGPIEAVTATGANRLQTIAYAVIPQIIPPYISFTMYRWDINVRMSTIIGFAGGGGIGFLLQQNINMLNYRAASAQMLAIAVVVASTDYLSSTLREKFV